MEQPLAPPAQVTFETLLSEQLLKLSFNDRNEIEEEIHGVGCRSVEETPKLVRAALHQFDALLNQKKEQAPHQRLLRNVAHAPGDATGANLLDAANHSGCYLNDPDVRLCFLRCELFAVEKAVERLLVFLEVTAELFGDFVADRPVRRSDFTTRENALLKKSRMQFLPFRDRSGRRVLVSCGHVNLKFQPPLLKWKILMYLHWINANEVETQRKGMALHLMCHDEPGEEEWNEVKWGWDIKMKDVQLWKKSYRAFPVRIVCRQSYLDDTPAFRLQALYATYYCSPEVRKITKLHFGGQIEMFHKMASFGVPVDVFPMTPSGTLKFSNHCAWLDVMEHIEKGSFDNRHTVVVACPLLHDVVFRVGTGFSQKNPGNAHLRSLIQASAPAYSAGDKAQKQAVVELVYNDIVEGHNGRFLEWWKQGKAWTVIRDQGVARQKITKLLVDKSHRLKKKAATTTRKLDRAIAIATSLEHEDDHHPKQPISALHEYYSKEHPPKRRKKTFDCGACDSREFRKEDGAACFGRTFFSVED